MRIRHETPRLHQANRARQCRGSCHDFGLPLATLFPCGLGAARLRAVGHKTALSTSPSARLFIRYGEVIAPRCRPFAPRIVDEAASTCLKRRAPTNWQSRPPCRRSCRRSKAILSRFRNRDGSVGTKNILAFSTSVQCVKGTLEYAVKDQHELLRNIPMSRRLAADACLWLRRRHYAPTLSRADPHLAKLARIS